MIVRDLIVKLVEEDIDNEVLVRIGDRTFDIDGIVWKLGRGDVELEIDADAENIANAVGASIPDEE